MTSVDQKQAARGRLRRDLRDALPEYEPIEPPEIIAARLGIPPDRIVKLDGNENPYGPSELAIAALRELSGQVALYPDPEQRELRAAIAAYAGVGPEQVVAGAGSDELIDLLIRLFVEPGEAVVTCTPTFGMYRYSTLVQGGRPLDVPRRGDFSVDVEAVATAVETNAAKIIFVASPNNPTGNGLSPAQVDGLVATGALVVLDEAYVEFAGTGGYAARVREGTPNLVVLRTFSKWAGLAGLRVGYAICPEDIGRLLMAVKQPYTPNVAGTVAALASLGDVASLMERVHTIAADAVRLAAAIERIPGLRTYPSQANFVLVRVQGKEARWVRDELRARGIFVRYFATPPIDDCLRISAGTPEQNDAVVACLREIMGG